MNQGEWFEQFRRLLQLARHSGVSSSDRAMVIATEISSMDLFYILVKSEPESVQKALALLQQRKFLLRESSTKPIRRKKSSLRSQRSIVKKFILKHPDQLKEIITEIKDEKFTDLMKSI